MVWRDVPARAESITGFTRGPVTVDGRDTENGSTGEHVQPEAVMLGLHAYTPPERFIPASPEPQPTMPRRGSVAS
jgi:hypothetical protein